MQIYNKINNMKADKAQRIKEFETEMAKVDEEIVAYANKVEKFSKFNDEDIIAVLTRLCSTFEGEEYVSTQVSYSFVRYFEVHGGYFHQYTNKPLIIVAKRCACESYDDEEENALIPLIMAKKAMILADIYHEGGPIYFYSSCGQDINFHGDIRIPYVRSFIDMVISYRIENNLENIERAKLEELLNDFLSKNQEAIVEHQTNIESSLEQAPASGNQVKKLSKTPDNQLPTEE